MKNIKQVNALITGAYGGIGSALSLTLAEQGANLYLVGRDQNKLDKLKAQLIPSMLDGREVKTFCVDLSSKEQVKRLNGNIRQQYTSINTLINNAGISHFGLIEDTSDDILVDMLNINVLSQMRLTKSLLPLLKSQDKSRIVNIGSVFGSIGYPAFSAYSSSKFALKGFSEALGRELSDSSVSVGYFMARATNTPLNNSAVVALNKALSNPVDSPVDVAIDIANFIQSNAATSSMGWPETVFIRINALIPKLVSQSIGKQLSTIKRFAIEGA